MYNHHQKLYKGIGDGTFSPLFIAVGSVTHTIFLFKGVAFCFQSAFHRGMGVIDNSNHFIYCFSQKSDLRR